MHWTQRCRLQGGLISRRQLHALGLARAAIDNLVRSGRLEPTTCRGVYRAAATPVTTHTAPWFAVLRTNSPLSFASAAAWWGMPVLSDGLVHITRWDRRRLTWPPGVRVHRVALAPSAVVEHMGMDVTTRVETILDCMGYLPIGPARTLADRALQQRWLAVEDAARRLETQPGRWGNRQIRRLLTQIGDGAAAESERRLHRILRQAGITGWVPNLAVTAINGQRFEIDVAFPAAMLAIEVDGYAYHSDDARFQGDRTRQNALIASGWRVLRFTWADLERRPRVVIRQIQTLLAA